MPSLRIRESSPGGYLAFDLQDLLELLGTQGEASLWKCKVEEAITNDLPVDIVSAFNVPGGHDGRSLAKLAAVTRQVCDGEFEAFDLHSAKPWIKLTAVDSSYWEVWTERETALRPFQIRFEDAELIEDDAEPAAPADAAKGPPRG